MKPVYIVLLVAAGAGSGALLMSIAQRRERPAPVPVTVQAPAGAQAVSPAAPPASVPLPVVSAEVARNDARPSPWEAPRPGRTHTAPPPVSTSAPQVGIVRPTPPPVVASPPVQPPAEHAVTAPSQPAIKKEEPVVPPTPPARVEPEHATPAAPPAPPEPAKVTLNAGTLIPVRLVDGLNAGRNVPGDPFTATLDKELVADGFVIAERGARVDGRVTAADPGGRVKGVSTLTVELTRIHTSDGQVAAIRTVPFERRAEPTHGEDAAKVGAGAAIGAVIGGIAGGGKGAAIGAGAGGAAGVGTVLATRGRPAMLASETRINFSLASAVTLTERAPR